MDSITKKIAIFGGSFSPPHMGHVLSARAYLEASGADRIVIIPAKRPPHKVLDGMVDDSQRMYMCELAFCSDVVLNGKCIISDYEISRDAVSYTVNTIEHFIDEGYRDISILIGTDMLLTFESWHRYKDLFSYVDIYCVNRYDRAGSKMQQVAQRYHNEYGARIHLITAPPFEVSSTDIRDKLSRRESLEGLIPHKVEEYIIKNGLYK